MTGQGEAPDRLTALVTGGNRGIGLAIATALAEQGHRVAVTGRDRAALDGVAAAVPGVLALEADVADPERTTEVVAGVVEALGPVDVLVNNAGIGGGDAGPRPLVDEDPTTWWRVLETNLRGPMLHTHAVLPGMIARGRGVIVNVGSYLGVRPSPTTSAYATSKAALARFTDTVAAEVVDTGVQVFCVSPGLVLTDSTRGLPWIDDIPADEFHQPTDVARLVCALASGDHGALSGRFFHVMDDLAGLHAQVDRIRSQGLHQLRLSDLDGLVE